jgi:hypothetical protein
MDNHLSGFVFSYFFKEYPNGMEPFSGTLLDKSELLFHKKRNFKSMPITVGMHKYTQTSLFNSKANKRLQQERNNFCYPSSSFFSI